MPLSVPHSPHAREVAGSPRVCRYVASASMKALAAA